MVDFGIAGKTAIVCASSKGLGLGCADALAAVGVNLVMNARTAETLAQAAHTIRDRHGVHVIVAAEGSGGAGGGDRVPRRTGGSSWSAERGAPW